MAATPLVKVTPASWARWLPSALLVAASVALAASLAWSPPPPAGGGLNGAVDKGIIASRVAAAVLVAAAVVSLAALQRTAPLAAAANGAIWLVVASALALALASPAPDIARVAALHARYDEEAGAAALARERALVAFDEDHLVLSVSRAYTSASSPVVLGPVPVTRGDRWSVSLRVEGPRWEDFTPPSIEVDRARCESTEQVDRFDAPPPSYAAFWACTATSTGLATVVVSSTSPETRDYQIGLYAYPVRLAVLVPALRESAVALSGVAAIAGAAAAFASRGDAKDSPRRVARAAAALAVATACGGFGYALVRVGASTSPGPFRAIVVMLAPMALASAAAALAAAYAWTRPGTAFRAGRFARFAATGALVALPLSALLVHGPLAPAAFPAMGAALAVACIAALLRHDVSRERA